MKLLDALKESSSSPKGVIQDGYIYFVIKYDFEDTPWLRTGVGTFGESLLSEKNSRRDDFEPYHPGNFN